MRNDFANHGLGFLGSAEEVQQSAPIETAAAAVKAGSETEHFVRTYSAPIQKVLQEQCAVGSGQWSVKSKKAVETLHVPTAFSLYCVSS
jgi:hypothetical protein